MQQLSAPQAIRERFSSRHFSDRQITDQQLTELLELANRAPSGFNFQPWQFVVVREPEVKAQLKPAVLDQPQVTEASAVVVFIADADAAQENYEKVLALGVETGAMTPRHADYYRKSVKRLFLRKPFNLIGLGKWLVVSVLRIFRPIPDLVFSGTQAQTYVARQSMLAAATLMIAAKSFGIDSSPMEGFDECRVKQILKIPAPFVIPIIVALGYSAEGPPTKPSVRLPLKERVFWNRYS